MTHSLGWFTPHVSCCVTSVSRSPHHQIKLNIDFLKIHIKYLKKSIDKPKKVCYYWVNVKKINVEIKKIKLEVRIMNQMPGKCPVCDNTLNVTRLQCGQCGTAI